MVNGADWTEQFRIHPDTKVKLKHRPTRWRPPGVKRADAQLWGRERVENLGPELAAGQSRLYATGGPAVLVIVQGMDTAGKDGVIRHVIGRINPVGLTVKCFAAPTEEEMAHHFLWRAERALPEPGHIGVFNRSYYEEIMYLRVHPELVVGEPAPDEAHYRRRLEDILDFERRLARSGIAVLKFFLHISKREQRRRLQRRVTDPTRWWKYDPSDLADRALWRRHREVFESALAATSTEAAPWWVIPADDKWVARALVAEALAARVHALAPRFPEPTGAEAKELERARAALS